MLTALYWTATTLNSDVFDGCCTEQYLTVLYLHTLRRLLQFSERATRLGRNASPPTRKSMVESPVHPVAKSIYIEGEREGEVGARKREG